jgi:hypothetical protein
MVMKVAVIKDKAIQSGASVVAIGYPFHGCSRPTSR